VPTARVKTRLARALIEQIDQARGSLARSEYLAMISDAEMTHQEPHLPTPGEKAKTSSTRWPSGAIASRGAASRLTVSSEPQGARGERHRGPAARAARFSPASGRG